MTKQNLLRLKESLENTLLNVEKMLENDLNYPILTQFDEGGYTEGYQHSDVVLIDSLIEEEDGVMLIRFYAEKE